MNAFLQSEFCGRLCLALAHSLWQAGAGAVVVSGIAFALRQRSASVRYNVYLAGLVVSLAAFPVTLATLDAPRSTPTVNASAELQNNNEPLPASSVTSEHAVPARPIESSLDAPTLSPAPRAPRLAAPALPRFAPWIAAAYLMGVCAMALRLALGMWSAGALSRRAAGADCELVARLERIARQWRLRIVPRLAVSAEVVVPKVVGLLKPVILLPLSATTGLAPDELDMILAHELAHVRRHDLWINLLQRVAETVLFFNPAIWYLSRRLTSLREYASDELVCSGAAVPTARYAAALVRVAELSRPRAAAEIAAVAATGKNPSELRRRVARLVGEPLREPVRLTRGGVMVLMTVALFSLASPYIWTTNAADEIVKEPAQAETETKAAQENETESIESPDASDRFVEQLRSLQKRKKEIENELVDTQTNFAFLQAEIDQDVKRQVLKDPTKVKVDAQVRQRQKYLQAAIEVQKAELSALHQAIKKLRDAVNVEASPDAKPPRDSLDAQVDEMLKSDAKAAMLQQEIMTRDYWIMQLKAASKRGSSPQIKQYEKERAAMQKQVDEYREKLKKQLKEQLEARPFVVRGSVADQEGKPMEGVVIRAATGVGTLRGGGSTVTDAEGRYTLRFGPGMKFLEDYAPLGVGVQAAVISARKPGWYEVNLNRQGDLLMSDQQPESLKKEDLWGKESTDSVVFPNEPREVNFTLAPAVVIEGQLVGDGTWEIEDQYLTLTGEELPPAQNVFTSATTNQDGKFEMDAVPPGKPWRFRMRISGTRGEVLSDPFTVAQPGVYRCVVSLDTEARDDGSVVLNLRQEAAETP